MLRTFFTCLVVLVGVSVLLPGATTMPAAGTAAISVFLKEAVDKGQVPGIVALVVGRDGVVYCRSWTTPAGAGPTAPARACSGT